MTLCFELSMPTSASWNNRWSGENDFYALLKSTGSKEEMEKFKELSGGCWTYRWDDGWSACITARIVNSKEWKKISRKSKGFCGYEWMVESILKHGEIILEESEVSK